MGRHPSPVLGPPESGKSENIIIFRDMWRNPAIRWAATAGFTTGKRKTDMI